MDREWIKSSLVEEIASDDDADASHRARRSTTTRHDNDGAHTDAMRSIAPRETTEPNDDDGWKRSQLVSRCRAD